VILLALHVNQNVSLVNYSYPCSFVSFLHLATLVSQARTVLLTAYGALLTLIVINVRQLITCLVGPALPVQLPVQPVLQQQLAFTVLINSILMYKPAKLAFRIAPIVLTRLLALGV